MARRCGRPARTRRLIDVALAFRVVPAGALALPLMAFRQSPLIDPPPIGVAASISPDQALKAIRIARPNRSWTSGG
jgi:hypothetical protein